MSTNEHFRLGLQYVIELSPSGTKSKLANCARIDRGNFSNMLSGNRPFPENKRPLLARCMMHNVRDLERLGMDISEGVKDSLHKEVVMANALVLPEITKEPDLNVFAVNVETLESYQVGEGWSLDNQSIMVEFDRVPCYQARYIFKPKPVLDVLEENFERRERKK